MSNPPIDENAFLEKHAQLVYNLALRLTGNPTDAEDLAQEALLRALKALPEFRGESAHSTWLYRITVNAWKNRVRSEKRRALWRTISLSLFQGKDDDEEPLPVKADEPPLDRALEASEHEAVVQKALLSLDDEARAIVVLRDIEGLSYKEISEALDIPEGTVKSRLSRAREALRGRLEKYVNQ